MSDLRERAKDTIDSAAIVAKKATDMVVERVKDVAHAAGNKLDKGAKKLKDA